ncbi:response regulator [Salinispirillum marinum]|uniref:Response regulator n=2 Tax=Saccharospirillaceae TaxID=255527 RepID=A0ABV8BEP6_9GAMM
MPQVSAPQITLHVLIAEDNPVNQAVVQGLVRALGHTAKVVPHGQAAVDERCAEGARFDVILMDIDMPVLDGLGALKAIRAWENDQQQPTMPIVALSGFSLDEFLDDHPSNPFTDYLTKPLSKDSFKECLDALFRRVD